MFVRVCKDWVCHHSRQTMLLLFHLDADSVVRQVVVGRAVHPTGFRACFVRRQIEVHRNQPRLEHSRYRRVVRPVAALLDLGATNREMVGLFRYSMHGVRGRGGYRLQCRRPVQSCPVAATAKRHNERWLW